MLRPGGQAATLTKQKLPRRQAESPPPAGQTEEVGNGTNGVTVIALPNGLAAALPVALPGVENFLLIHSHSKAKYRRSLYIQTGGAGESRGRCPMFLSPTPEGTGLLGGVGQEVSVHLAHSGQAAWLGHSGLRGLTQSLRGLCPLGRGPTAHSSLRHRATGCKGLRTRQEVFCDCDRETAASFHRSQPTDCTNSALQCGLGAQGVGFLREAASHAPRP